MNLRVLLTVFAVATLFAVTAFAQPARLDLPFQVRYAANISPSSPIDSFINITNTGGNGSVGLQSGTSPNIPGSICVHVYTFSPDEQMISCCSCPVTPNGLKSLSVKSDLVNNTLTPAVPSAVVIKLWATEPTTAGPNKVCNAASPGNEVDDYAGLAAWGTTSHATSVGGTPTAVTETPFTPSRLSYSEREKLIALCTFIQANGSGYGICNSCRLGALGAARR